MKILNIIKYHFIYIFTFCLTLFWVKSAKAGVISDLLESVKEKGKELVAEKLGIDITDNCKVPSFVAGAEDPNANCLFCGMFRSIFNAGSLVAGKAYSTFSDDLGNLLIVFLAVSIALIVLKNLATMGGTDTPSIMNSILQKMFIAATIYFIISGEYYPILNLTVVPIYKTGLGLFGTETCAQAAGIIGFSENFVAGDSTTGGLPTSLGSSIVCTIRDLETKVTALFDLGDWAFCRGLGPDRIFIVLPNLIHLIDGVLFYLCGLVLMVMYPWILTDAAFQLALSFAILPFAICGYAFQKTNGYLPKVFGWVLNSLFVFIFMHILLECLNTYLRNIIIEALQNSGGDAKVLFTHPVKGIAFYGIGAVKIVFIVYIIYLYIPIISDLASNFAGGAGLSAGKAMDTFMRNQVNKQGEKLGKEALKLSKDAAEWGGNRVTGLGRRGMMKIASRNGGVRIPFTNKRYETKTVNGKKYLQKTKTGLFSKSPKYVKLYDEYSIITIKYKNGVEVGRHVEFKDSWAKGSLLDAKGNIDKAVFSALMSSSLAQDPAYKQMFMEQIAINALEAKGKKVGKHFSSRNVTFDARNPNEIFIDQVDHNGRVTKVQMKIDPSTGQVAIAHATKRVDNKLLRRQGVSNKEENFMQKLRRERNIKKIQNKLGRNTHADGLFYSYDKVVDGDGVDHYQKRLRSFWNVKNYFRTGKNTLDTVTDLGLRGIGATVDAPLGTISTIGLAIKAVFSGKARADLKDKFKNIGDEIKNIPAHEKRRYASDIHTGNVKDYSSKGYTKTNSSTGTVEKRVAADATVTTNIDGSRVYVDNASGGIFANEGLSGDFELFFTNGSMEFTTSGVMGKDGILSSEVSKFKYGAHIQKGHDSILDRSDAFQVIDSNGTVASDVDPNKLFFGLDNMLGMSTIDGTATTDYIKDKVFVQGRKRRTNRVRSNFGMKFF